VLTVLGSTDLKAPVGFAGLAIGLVLTLIHLVGIPITNTSVNPARSIGPAIFVGGWAVSSCGFLSSHRLRVPPWPRLYTAQ
jgi:aquaporin Z